MKFDDLESLLWEQYGRLDLKPINDLRKRLTNEVDKTNVNEERTIRVNEEEFLALMECINGTYYQLGDAKNHIDDFLDRREYLENVIADAYDVIARTDEPHEVLQNLEIIEKAHKVLRLEREML